MEEVKRGECGTPQLCMLHCLLIDVWLGMTNRCWHAGSRATGPGGRGCTMLVQDDGSHKRRAHSFY
jgi:hypothetical protein